jgi:PAS domain S-box-containing protein
VCLADWHVDEAAMAPFARASRELLMPVGDGVPGRVFARNRPAWIEDLAADSNAPRGDMAGPAGICTVFGLPVPAPSGECLAAIEFGLGERRSPDRPLIATAVSLGRTIGVWIQHRRSERAVQAGQARKQAMLDAALDCVITIDHRGGVVEVNPAFERTFGWSAEEAVGREMAELIVPERLRAAHRAGLARVLGEGPPRLLGRRVETVGARRDGSELPVELAITRIALPGPPMFTGHVRDITERKASLEELRASRARIVDAADEARRRIERDLHDGAQQRLVALALDLRLVRQQVGDGHASAELLDDALAELDQATAELRELARGIHPAILTERGLGPALRGLARRAGVPVELDAELDERLPAPVEAGVYFLVAEALTNVARSAEAGVARVSVVRSGDRVSVAVADDGRGGAQVGAGSGLRGLADRVAALDGSFEVVSPRGEGTVVRAVIPCGS